MLYTHVRNYGCRLNVDLKYKGLRLGVLENEYLKITVVIDRGSDIMEFLYKPLDVDFMWLSPWGIRDSAKFIPSISSTNGNFMDYYAGGWQEIIPNFGNATKIGEVEYGQHGEVSLIPWDYKVVEDHPSTVSLQLQARTYRAPFYIEKTLTLKTEDPRLYIQEKIKNEGHAIAELVWAHHPAFGKIFLNQETVINIPKNKVKFLLQEDGPLNKEKLQTLAWPMLKGYHNQEVDFSKPPLEEDHNHYVDEVCLGNLNDSWFSITNQKKGIGFGMRWEKEVFPYLWIWRMYGKGSKQPPWWGRVNCFAIEPVSSLAPYGLASAMGNQTSIKLQPQQEIHSSLLAVCYRKKEQVRGIDQLGNVF